MERSGIDLDRLNDLTDGNRDEMRALLDLYFQETSQHFSQLHEALAKKSAEKIVHAAHTCCGASLTCGIQSVAAPLRELENDARVGELDRAGVLIERAETEFASVRRFFEQYFNS